MLSFSRSDATPAYRGYRLQTLYTLSRILEPVDSNNLIFQPEGEEDLAIYDAENKLIEIVQVKARSEDLNVSSLKPNKKDSFFYRVNERLKDTPSLKIISIASFGAIGQEMRQACGSDTSKRKKVAKKISEHKILSEIEAFRILTKTQLIPVNEAELTDKIYAHLQQMLTGVDPESAFEMLNFWLYICAENRRKINQINVVDKINKVGRFLAERAAHHKEWFTSILPIEERDINTEEENKLSDEFYRGISARYEHILANVDILRHAKLQEIAKKLEENRVVIIHGASGQGKTTLAYRYLQEFFPNQWRFKVELIDSREHALSIATAIAAHADAIGVPIAVYFDVSPNDIGWIELVGQLSTRKNICVIVTVREEDFRRTSISGVEVQFSTVELSFNRNEAQEIYQSLTSKKLPAEFLTFEDAWYKFGGSGPLMEFVYLVTQGDSLRERLSQQVRRLEDEVRTGKLNKAEIELLRMVSVASAFECKLQVKPLAKHLGLTAPKRTFELFDKEYLLRLSEKDTLINGLHPIRSTILSELLNDPTFSPWSESASACLPFIVERDVESFLLYAFSRHRSAIELLLQSIAVYQPEQWTAIAGVTRALIWLGIVEYTEANQQLIREVFEIFGTGWNFVLDFDIACATSGLGTSWWQDLENFIPQRGQEEILAFQARQTDNKQVFIHAKTWLSNLTKKPTEPISDAEWSGMAETIFWIGNLGVSLPLEKWLSLADIDTEIDVIPINILADLILGLSYGHKERLNIWLENNRAKLINRFRQETQTILLEDDGQKLTAHFIVDILQSNTSQSEAGEEVEITKNRLHEEAALRYELLRKLLPDREKYACQGYGHKVWSDELPFDDTQKTGISKSYLLPSWLTSVNSTFRGVTQHSFRPSTWQEYANLVLILRQTILQALKQLENALEVYFRKQQNVTLIGKYIDAEQWDNCRRILRITPLLPQCAFDEWGFVDESASDSSSQKAKNQLPIVTRHDLVSKIYKPLLTSFGNYTHSLSKFFQQSINALVLNPVLGKEFKTEATKNKIIEVAESQGIQPHLIRLSTLNLADTTKGLINFQKDFRNLLASFVSLDELESLEKEEQKVYKRVWNIWYLFASKPNLRLQNALQESTNQLSSKIKRVKNKLRRKLRDISSYNLHFNIVSEDIFWEREKALWIKIDGDNPIDVYNSLENVILAIQQSFFEVENDDLRHYLSELYFPYVVILPLVKGKCLNATAWRFYIPVLLSANEENELKWWNFVLNPIPPDAFIKLGLNIWTDSRIELVNKLVESVSHLSLLASHIRDFQRLPELDERGQEQYQQYIQNVSLFLNETLQLVIDTEAEILNFFNEISSSEYEQRPSLVEAISVLTELHSQILPTSDYQDGATIDFDGLVEWANRLEMAKQYAGLTYLLWVSDVVN